MQTFKFAIAGTYPVWYYLWQAFQNMEKEDLTFATVKAKRLQLNVQLEWFFE